MRRRNPTYTIGASKDAGDRGIPAHSWSFRVDKKRTTAERRALLVLFNDSFVVPLLEEDETVVLASLKKNYSLQISFRPVKRSRFGRILGANSDVRFSVGQVSFPDQPSAHYFWESYLDFMGKEETDFPR